MLARLLIVAMLVGAVGAGVALWFGLPLWAIPLAYSLVGAATLGLGGFFAAVAGSRPAHRPGYGRV